MTKKSVVIAIDGPAGAGKSTIAKLVAKKLGFIYIDTGAMYRSIALKALDLNIIDDEAKIEEMAAKIDISFQAEQDINRVFVDGKEVTDAIRSTDVTSKSSYVACLAGVRSAMVRQQRILGSSDNVVMDGRDVGTCIFPDATVKVFLTASSEERARRRYEELVAKGQMVDINVLQKEMQERDKNDQERELSPLKKADDAIEIDSTKLSIKEVVQQIVDLVGRK